MLVGIDRLNIKDRLEREADPLWRHHLPAVRFFEVAKQIANHAINRIAEFGLSQPGLDDLARREYRELTHHGNPHR